MQYKNKSYLLHEFKDTGALIMQKKTKKELNLQNLAENAYKS